MSEFEFKVSLLGHNGRSLQIEHGPGVVKGTVGFSLYQVGASSTLGGVVLPLTQVRRLRDLLTTHLDAEDDE